MHCVDSLKIVSLSQYPFYVFDMVCVNAKQICDGGKYDFALSKIQLISSSLLLGYDFVCLRIIFYLHISRRTSQNKGGLSLNKVQTISS